MATQSHWDEKQAQDLIKSLQEHVKELKGTPGIRAKSALRLMESSANKSNPEMFARQLESFVEQLDAANYPADGDLRKAIAGFKDGAATAPAQVQAASPAKSNPDPAAKPDQGAPARVPGILFAPDSDRQHVGHPMEMFREGGVVDDQMGNHIRDFLRAHTAIASPYFPGVSEDVKSSLKDAVKKAAGKLNPAEVYRELDENEYRQLKQSEIVKSTRVFGDEETSKLAAGFAQSVLEAPAGNERDAALAQAMKVLEGLVSTTDAKVARATRAGMQLNEEITAEIDRNNHLKAVLEKLPGQIQQMEEQVTEFGQAKQDLLDKLRDVKAGKDIEPRTAFTPDEESRAKTYPLDGSRRPEPDHSYRERRPSTTAPAPADGGIAQIPDSCINDYMIRQANQQAIQTNSLGYSDATQGEIDRFNADPSSFTDQQRDELLAKADAEYKASLKARTHQRQEQRDRGDLNLDNATIAQMMEAARKACSAGVDGGSHVDEHDSAVGGKLRDRTNQKQ